MQRADAIVVFGCRVTAGAPSTALERRLRLARHAYQAGAAPWVIVSGGRRWQGEVEALVMRDRLVALGIPAEAVSIEAASLTTRGNCALVAPMIRARGGRRALAATCAWHLPRALAGLARRGLVPVEPPAAWLTTPPPRLTQRWREALSTLSDAAIARIARPIAP